MKHLISFGIFFLLSIPELLAQANFRNGYIIYHNNDTIQGLIDYRGNKANTKKCTYRVDSNSENQIYTPDEIKAYRFTNSKYYISKPVPIGIDTQNLFLEYLINGIVDVYYYRDNYGEHYLVEDSTGHLYELKNEEKKVSVNNTVYFKESKEYIGILKALLKKSPPIAKKVDNVRLSHKSLISLTRDYHNEICSDEECIVYEKRLPKTKSTFGLIIGFGGTSILEIMERSPNELRYDGFGFNFFPSFGIYKKTNIPFLNEKLYLQHELTYSRTDMKSSSSYIEPLYNLNFLNDIIWSANMLNYHGLIKYEFPKGKVKPTFQAGGFVKYFFKSDYNRNLEVRYSSGNIYYTDQSNENPFSKFDMGISIGSGFKTEIMDSKEIFFDFRYQRGFGILEGLNTNTYSVNFGFQIGK